MMIQRAECMYLADTKIIIFIMNVENYLLQNVLQDIKVKL